MPGSVVLAAFDLTKRYRARTVVDRVSIAVEKGDVYGFLGPNGAGKSTTLRMLLGLVRPSGGRIELFGQALGDRRALARVGAIVESPSLYTYLSGRDNLRMLADLSGGAPASRLEEALARVDLRDRADDPVRIYSHGMKQRLAIAAALLPRPELIILDEPTNGLDPMGIRDMRSLVRSLAADDGITILLSSHLLAEVEQVCNRATIIARGSRIWEGEVAGLLAGRRRVRLRARPLERAQAIAQTLGVDVREVEPGVLHVARDGAHGEVTPAALVAKLAAAGVEVDEVVAEAPTLEEMFVSMVEEAAA
ncbi:MAG TPA: ATP-binding cassette domain-containing protein [Kofleriaceae bacterium]|nr:ATP-binding cassette domain-containing protein [Kofleriaceae bacterium]